jgi:white-opaque regulator 2
MLAGGYGAPANMAYDPALSAGVSSPGSASQQFDYASAIDPALEAAAPPTTAASGASYQTTTPGMPNFREDLKRDVQSASPFSSGASDHMPHLRGGASFLSPSSVASYEEDAAYTTTPAKRTVDQLLAMGGPVPPRSTTDISSNPTMLDEVKHLYYSIYAPGLENFLESKWFSVKGLSKLLDGKIYLEQFAALLQQFAKTSQNDQKEIQYTSSVEARVVWALASMVRTSAAESNGVKEFKTVPATDDPTEATNRLNVFETLLTGRVAANNPLTAPVAGSTDHHRLRELEFWYTLGNFVCHQYEDPTAAKEVDETLSALRNLLDGRENRDVLYSIAVVRGLGQRVSEYTDNDTPLHLDESDNKSKLLVAKKFVMDEAGGAGTTNVIRRLCDLSARSWSAPVATPATPIKNEK